MGQRYRGMEDQKSWPILALDQDFTKEGGLKPQAEKQKCLNWEKC